MGTRRTSPCDLVIYNRTVSSTHRNHTSVIQLFIEEVDDGKGCRSVFSLIEDMENMERGLRNGAQCPVCPTPLHCLLPNSACPATTARLPCITPSPVAELCLSDHPLKLVPFTCGSCAWFLVSES
ncbi:hypothetical protein SKAU_G00288550 [Synaphobranchus kaupii]|uniref:Uncharacterized protein n=1 Tax=Synaphobranchus kaupii TaxID=118154 RepID=A0A9Q1ET90_SYNKA|nr:hypothetical protein SKAU_G00288550 [Synaphobranchus kaupii]